MSKSGSGSFAPSALTRAAKGEIGARRDRIVEQAHTIESDNNSTAIRDAITQIPNIALQHDAITQRYSLPLPKPRQKKDPKVHTSVYMTAELLAWVKEYCHEHDLSMNGIIVEYLEELRRQES